MDARKTHFIREAAIFTALILTAVAFILMALTAPGANAAVPSYRALDSAALNWAEAHATGLPYQYGATGPYSYDCSGLVSTAYQRVGVNIGRDTAIQLATNGEGHFRRVPVADAPRGAVFFFGTGHEEFQTTNYHMTFGAHDWGTRIGWIRWGWGWYPTEAFVVVY
jgi:hypothetical protein